MICKTNKEKGKHMDINKDLTKQLFDKYKSGEPLSNKDQASFAELKEKFMKPIKQTCTKTITFKGVHMLLTANHTEQIADLESTVWEAILNNIKKNDLSSFFINPEGYIRRIASNKTIDFMRKIIRKHKHNSEAPGEDTVFVCYEDLLEDAHEASKSIDFSALSTIDETFKYLDENERNTLLLKGLGYTKKEMAENLGVCEKTVHNHLSIIKEKITRTHS